MRARLVLVSLLRVAADPPRWLEHAHRSLAGAGSRSGGARDEVMELLAHERCLLSAQEIHDLLRQRGRRVGMASVYRTLDLLSSHRLVRRVDVAGVASFEVVLSTGEHHHHLVCERCGRAIAFEDPGLEHALDGVQQRLGVPGAEHEVIIHAVCDVCLSTAA
jgi:Fur family ferric uptake transcriptional regulator